VITTTSLHYSQVDLSTPGILGYRYKGCAGAYCTDINATMDKASKNHLFSIEKIGRNLGSVSYGKTWRKGIKRDFSKIEYNNPYNPGS
jgi:hypothetical protein